MLLLDTGVLLAGADESDPRHEDCTRLIEAERGPLLTTPLVIAETAYLIDRQLGPAAEAQFFDAVANGGIRVETLDGSDYQRIAKLILTYADLPLGGTDASLVVVAERYRLSRIATLDRRHFTVVRPAHVPRLELVP